MNRSAAAGAVAASLIELRARKYVEEVDTRLSTADAAEVETALRGWQARRLARWGGRRQRRWWLLRKHFWHCRTLLQRTGWRQRVG